MGMAHYTGRMETISGKIAIVTGGTRGIGRAIAENLLRHGVTVSICGRSQQSVDRAVAAMKPLGTVSGYAADVTQPAQVAHFFEAVEKEFGGLDILVNNAGVYEFAPLDQITEEIFHKQFNLNVLGLLLTTKEASKYFNGDGGSVINISSAVTTLYPPGSATYTATKASVDAITVILSKELGPKGIRVNAINPGLVETEGVQAAGFIGSDFQKGIIAQTPLGRTGQPDDISPAAVFLASTDAKYVTGQTLNISGGIR